MTNRDKGNIISAVEYSILRDAIGHVPCDNIPEAIEVSRIIERAGYEVESYVETSEMLDIWGVDENGDAWRIAFD